MARKLLPASFRNKRPFGAVSKQLKGNAATKKQGVCLIANFPRKFNAAANKKHRSLKLLRLLIGVFPIKTNAATKEKRKDLKLLRPYFVGIRHYGYLNCHSVSFLSLIASYAITNVFKHFWPKQLESKAAFSGKASYSADNLSLR